MEKLIELLNEYVEKYNKSDLYYTFELEKDSWWLFCYDDVTDHKWWTMQDEAMVICSKKYWFIKWLVENEKIDRTFREDIKYPYYLEKEWLLQGYEKSDVIIMLLSIQDEPTRFLVSILK